MRRLVLLVLLFTVTHRMQSQEMAVPVGLQYTLLMKVLAFDRALQSRGEQEIVVGVLYQSKFRSSLLAKDELMRVAEAGEQKIHNVAVRWFPIDINEGSDLKAGLAKHHIRILYVAPIRAVEVEAIVAISHANKILTLTGVSGFVEDGLAVGIGFKGEKPQIEINLASAKAEGADFSSQLLNVAKIIE